MTSRQQGTKKRTSAQNDGKTLSDTVFGFDNKLEEIIEQIYQSKGFKTDRITKLDKNRNLTTKIVAEKGNQVIEIEHTKSTQEALNKLELFTKDLQGSNRQGVFVTYSLTNEVNEYAQSKNINVLDSSELVEKWWGLSVGGKQSTIGQKVELEYALPTNKNYREATKVQLQNPEAKEVSAAELTFHPYYVLHYKLKGQIKDPTKKTHKFKDEDTIFVDALDKTVLNQDFEKSNGLLNKLGNAISSNSKQNIRSKYLLKELKSAKKAAKYAITIEHDYKITVLKPIIPIRDVLKLAIEMIINRNKHKINYKLKKQKDALFHQSKSIEFVPKRKDITLISQNLVQVPRWTIQFKAHNLIYTRKMFAYSGTIVEDTILYCQKQQKTGLLHGSHKKAIALCEFCGKSFCENHIKKCYICGKWLCENDAVECETCKTTYCKEHKTNECQACKKK